MNGKDCIQDDFSLLFLYIDLFAIIAEVLSK